MSKIQLLTAIIAAIGIYGLGYEQGQGVTKEVDKKEVEHEQVKEKDHKTTTVTTTKDRQGNVKTVTVTSEDVDKNTSKSESIVERSKEDSKPALAKYKLYGIYSIRPGALSEGATYGAGGSVRVLGPIDVGAFGLTNGTLGLTIGVEF